MNPSSLVASVPASHPLSRWGNHRDRPSTPNPLQAPDRPPGSGAATEEEKKPYKNDNETYVRVIKQIYQKKIENQTTMMIKDKTELLCSKIAPNISYSEVSYT